MWVNEEVMVCVFSWERHKMVRWMILQTVWFCDFPELLLKTHSTIHLSIFYILNTQFRIKSIYVSWTVGGSRSTWRKPVQAHANSKSHKFKSCCWEVTVLNIITLLPLTSCTPHSIYSSHCLFPHANWLILNYLYQIYISHVLQFMHHGCNSLKQLA